MRRIAVVIAAVPQLLRDIITRAVDSEDDMHVTAQFADGEELMRSIGSVVADVVVLGLRQGEPLEDYRNLLYANPRVSAVAISPDAREAFLYRLRPEATPIGKASPTDLVAAIRNATYGEPGASHAARS